MPRDGTLRPETLTRWACVRTKPKAEFWARDNLFRVGFEVFLPLMSVRRRDRCTGRYEMSEVPLFTSYMFLAHVPGSPWRGVRGCPGVGALLLHGFVPQYAAVGAVEALMATEDVRRDPTPAPAWEPGVACTIGAGALAGHEGVVAEVRKSAARIGVCLFGQLTYASVPVENLLPRRS